MRRRITVVFVMYFIALIPLQAEHVAVQSVGDEVRHHYNERVLIAEVSDVRSILGTQGKNICVSTGGDDIAVIYGSPTPDPDNIAEIKVALSIDAGRHWISYGPFSSYYRRAYPSVDGSRHFGTNNHELYFTWQESPAGYITGDVKTMIEENTPSSPYFSTPLSLPHASSILPWLPCIAVAHHDPFKIIATAWSYIGGNYWAYYWRCEDGGYTWSDTIPMCHIDSDGCSGHLRFGTSDYVFYTYQDLYNWNGLNIIYPYYIESTDGGQTWSAETPMPEVPLLQADAQFWWNEFDCEVINDEPWAVHNDINQVFPDSADMWIFHGQGSPGNWIWDITGVHDYDLDTVIADTIFMYEARYYPSMSYDPISGMILVSFKAYYFKAYPDSLSSPTDTFLDGLHIGGIFSRDSGSTWTVAAPLSEWNTGQVEGPNWIATEVAHLLPNIDGDVYAYGIWVHEPSLKLYFEKGIIEPYLPINIGADEGKDGCVMAFHLDVQPSIVAVGFHVQFVLPKAQTASLNLYDAAGRFVRELYDGDLAEGTQSLAFDITSLANGVYFVSLETATGTQTAKFVVAR